MASWDFAAASLEMARTKSVAAAALSAQQAAAKAQVDTKAVQAAYQSASGSDDYATVRAQLEGFSRVATDYADQRNAWAARNPLARVGGVLADPGADLARARADLADGKPGEAGKALASAQRTSTLATVAGAAAVLLGVLALVGVVLVVWLRRRRSARTVDADGAAAPQPEHDGAPWTQTAS
jgi:cobalamin biosynthesis Mg chelatase CobN